VSGVSSHLLVSLHTFLEMLYYGAWLIAVPWAARHSALWDVADAPLARRSAAWTRGLGTLVFCGLGLVAILWLGFLADYPVTRDIYFTAATARVLAEVPFLLRAL
jgi:hypothetical protein